MAPIGPEDLGLLTETAQRELAYFQDSVRQCGISAVDWQLSETSASRALPLAARYCDLLLIGQSHVADALIADTASLARTVLVYAPCPVLVVPPGTPAPAPLAGLGWRHGGEPCGTRRPALAAPTGQRRRCRVFAANIPVR